MNKRIELLDVMKGLLICLMVIGHAIQLFNGELYTSSQSYLDNIIYICIYSFHMPLFMLISGFLFSRTSRRSLTLQKIFQKCLRYYLPIVTFALVKTVEDTVTGDVYSVLGFIKQLVYYNFHRLWFLWALIVAAVLYYVLNRVHFHIAAIILLILFVFFTPDMMMTNMYKYTVPFFFLGTVLEQKEEIIRKSKYQALLYGSIPLWIIMLFLFNREKYIYTTGVSLVPFFHSGVLAVSYQLVCVDLYRYIIGILGCLAVFIIIGSLDKAISRISELKWVNGIFVHLGCNTLGIYIISTEVLNEITYNFFKNAEYNLWRTLLLSLIILLVSDLLTVVIKHIPGLRICILGMISKRKEITGDKPES